MGRGHKGGQLRRHWRKKALNGNGRGYPGIEGICENIGNNRKWRMEIVQ
jgi:hypothetical protein